MRFFVYGCLLVAYVSANGCALDRMVRLTLKTQTEKQDTQRLNTQLQQLLNEKQAMLQTISFAARHQNFPAIMSSLNHEISQPLGALRLNAEFLQSDDPALSAQEREIVLEQLVLSTQAVHQVVQDFRRFFNAGQGQATVFALDVLLTDVLRSLSSEFARVGVMQQRGVLTPVLVRGDAVQLESAISGLVQFLLARLPSGSPSRFFAELVVDAGFAHLRLLTDGPQLRREDYERALSRVSADVQSGSDRHLWLARAIVENHGGAMNVFADELWSGVCVQLPVSGGEE
jgi:K+-sensing histidine kinase KdpD